MEFGFWTGRLVTLMLLWTTTKCGFMPEGVCHMECHDRYLVLAVDLAFTGQEFYFEGVDRTGVFPITARNAAKCGYSVSVLPVQGIVELRASYFSCHTANKNDNLFTFTFNLITKRDDKAVPYALNKTCSPSLLWSSREVTCEGNYMEVSVGIDMVCPLGTEQEGWDAAVRPVYGFAASGWQVIFDKEETQMTPMNLSEAHFKGYTFNVTDSRMVFRTAYGQPHSLSTVIAGVPVEVVRATLVSRQSWLVLLVDLVAACTMYEAPYDKEGFMIWETPDGLYPELQTKNVSLGLNGKLLVPTVAVKKGYSIKNYNNTVQIGIPYNAEGAYRKSIVTGDLYDLYTYHFYMEQLLMDQENIETRVRFHRKLASPPLKRDVFTENRTVLNERLFTVYLGNVPDDVELVAFQLNEKTFKAPLINSSTCTVAIAVHLNRTYGYTLKVPFDDPSVIQQFSRQHEAMEHKLDIVYNLTVRPKSEPYYHRTSVAALTAVSPPRFNTSCSKSGISFKHDHNPWDFLWELTVGSDPLTLALASKQGYIMSNDSKTLQLHVPLFTPGFEYENVSLKGFNGTFEILVRDRKTYEVRHSAVKTCPFPDKEIVVCSTDGRMTVVADLPEIVASGGSPAKTTLSDKYCGPLEAKHTRALFSFPLNSCGSRVGLIGEYVTYTNEISSSVANGSDAGSVTVQCTYPLVELYRLFSVYRFESENPGVGRILRSANFTKGHTTYPTTTVPVARRTMKPPATRPPYRPFGHYAKVSRYFKNFQKKGVNQHSYVK